MAALKISNWINKHKLAIESCWNWLNVTYYKSLVAIICNEIIWRASRTVDKPDIHTSKKMHARLMKISQALALLIHKYFCVWFVADLHYVHTEITDE